MAGKLGRTFAFMGIPAPAGQGAYTAGARLLKTLCWFLFILAVVGLAVLAYYFLIYLMFRSAFGRQEGLPGFFLAILLLLLFVAILALMAFAAALIGLMFWGSYVYLSWTERRRSGGLVGARFLASILGGLALLGVLGAGAPAALENAATDPAGMGAAAISGLFLLVCLAILSLTFSSSVRGVFALGPTLVATPAAPRESAPRPTATPAAGSAGWQPVARKEVAYVCPECARPYILQQRPHPGTVCPECAARPRES